MPVGGLPTKQPAAAFAADPTESPVMFVVVSGGLWKSSDRGQSWRRLPAAPGDITALAVHLEKHEQVFAGTLDGRIVTSVDGGTSWQARP